MSTCLAKPARVKKVKTPDFKVRGSGSIFQVCPVTPEAKQWVENNVVLEGYQWLGTWFSVEHRYIENLIDGVQAEGFTVAHE